MDSLNQVEAAVVKRCLFFAANSDVFDDSEMYTLLGAKRADVRRLALVYPDQTQNSEVLVQNVLNNLTGYPHSRLSEMELAVGATCDELSRILEKLGSCT